MTDTQAGLLPCPFCGNAANVDLTCDTLNREVYCCECQSSVQRPSEAEAIAAWNRRSTPALAAMPGGVDESSVEKIARQLCLDDECDPDAVDYKNKPQWMESRYFDLASDLAALGLTADHFHIGERGGGTWALYYHVSDSNWICHFETYTKCEVVRNAILRYLKSRLTPSAIGAEGWRLVPEWLLSLDVDYSPALEAKAIELSARLCRGLRPDAVMVLEMGEELIKAALSSLTPPAAQEGK